MDSAINELELTVSKIKVGDGFSNFKVIIPNSVV